MPDYNEPTLTRLVSQLRNSLHRLKILSHLGKDAFLKDPDKIGSAKYHFIVAIESCIDICNHLIAKNGYRAPEDYSDTFAVLSEVGAFESGFSAELKKMAKFRNRLVHLYWEVDDEQVYDILQHRLADFDQFQRDMAAFLQLGNL